jgi:hypothetical protein
MRFEELRSRHRLHRGKRGLLQDALPWHMRKAERAFLQRPVDEAGQRTAGKGYSLDGSALRDETSAERGLVGVAVVMAFGCGAGHFFNGDDAAVGFRAADVFKLDGGVADVEMVFEDVVEIEQDAGAL